MPINFTQISNLVNLPRDWIENVLKEVVDAFWRIFQCTNKATSLYTVCFQMLVTVLR